MFNVISTVEQEIRRPVGGFRKGIHSSGYTQCYFDGDAIFRHFCKSTGILCPNLLLFASLVLSHDASIILISLAVSYLGVLVKLILRPCMV
jgi:hypothetical protein